MALSLKRCARSNQNHLRDCCNVCFEFCFMFKFSCLLFWSLVMVPFSHVILLPSCNPGAHSSSDRCLTFCYGFRVERHVSWKRCATGFEGRFLLFGVSVKNVSPISSNMYIKPRGIKETAHTMSNNDKPNNTDNKYNKVI